MKKSLLKFTLLFSFSLVLIGNLAIGQCTINDVGAEIVNCTDGEFDVVIDFEYQDVTNQFTITGNGVSYGTFEYANLPITLSSLDADCTTSYEFVVTDEVEGTCSNFVELGVVCCDTEECEIGNPEIVVSDCINGEFTLTVDFDYANTSSTFQIRIYDDLNEEEYIESYLYTDLPIDVVIANTSSTGFYFEVEDNESAAGDCLGASEFFNPCYEENASCEMTTLDFGLSPVCENGSIVAEWLIDGENISEVGFDILVDGVFQFFIPYEEDNWYDFQFEAPDNQLYTLTVCDNDNADCCISWELENPCYEENASCEMTTLDFGLSPVCENGSIVAEWLIDGENISEVGFDILVDGVFQFFIPYEDDNWYDFQFEAPDNQLYTLTVCDNDNADCCISWELENPCYEENASCQMTTLDFGLSPVCENGSIVAEWLIDGENISEVGFDILVDGVFQFFIPYEDDSWYDFQFEAPDNQLYTLTVCDNDNADCCISWELENPCYEENASCEMTTLDFGLSPVCENGSIVAEWLIDGENISEVGFDILVDGVFQFFIPYEEDNWYDFQFEAPDNQLYTLTVCDNDNADCCISWELENPCYEENASCEMTTLDFGLSPVCENGSIVAEWLIDGENISEVGFDILVDGVFQFFIPYEEDNWYDFQFEAPDNQLYTLTVCDNDNADCCISWELENPCYEENASCEMTTLDFGLSPVCENGSIVAEWLIDGENISEVGFDILVDGVFQFFIPYEDDSWYDFQFEAPDNQLYTLTVCDNDNADCCISWELENPCYEEGGNEDCEIEDLVIETSECEEGSFTMNVNFDHVNTTSTFQIRVYDDMNNAVYIESYPYTDLAIDITIENSTSTYFVIEVEDNDVEGCISVTEIENPCYEEGGGECEIYSIDFGPNPVCEDGVIVAEWYIFSENTSEVGFDILINNEFLVFVNYDGEGPYIFDIPAPETEYFTITACDNDNADCCYSWELENPCYENTGNCEIGNIETDILSCEDGLFDVLINFEHANTTNQFTIVGNGTNYGAFSYTDLPITLVGLEANCEVEYEFIVEDVIHEECSNFTGIGTVCCEEEDCEIVGLVIETSECEEGVFTMNVNFDHENTTSTFQIRVYDDMNETVYVESYSYADLPINISIENNESPYFVIEVEDNDIEGCSSITELENPCYEEGGNEDCGIVGLVIETSECEEGVFTMNVNFDHENTSSTFQIRVYDDMNETVYVESYSYADLPINISIENNESPYFVIEVEDNDIEGCSSITELENPCYEEGGNEDCGIVGLVIETSECEEGVFTMNVNFDHENTSSTFQIRVYDDMNETVYVESYSYADLPINISIENNESPYFVIEVEDNDIEGCSSITELENPCYEEGGNEDCGIVGLVIETSECEEGVFTMNVNFDHANTTSTFQIRVYDDMNETVYVESYSYADLPINISIENNESPYFVIEVEDNDIEGCSSITELENPCYEEGGNEDCGIVGLVIETSECEEGVFTMNVNFDHENTSSTFQIRVYDDMNETVYVESYSYADLPINISIENNESPYFVIEVEDNDIEGCSSITELENPCYEEGGNEECNISEFVAEVQTCADEIFDVIIDFEFDNVSDSFELRGNGIVYGTFSYNDLPVSLTELPADCTTEYEFVAIDSEDEECTSFFEIGSVCCPGFNNIDNLVGETVFEDDLFTTTFYIYSDLLPGCIFDVFVDGELFTTLEEDNSFFVLGPFECGSDQVIDIEIVNSCSNESTQFDYDLATISCVTNTVDLSEVVDLDWNIFNSILAVDFESNLTLDVQVLSVDGRLLRSAQNISGGWNLDLSSTHSGLYFVRLIDNNSGAGMIKKIYIP